VRMEKAGQGGCREGHEEDGASRCDFCHVEGVEILHNRIHVDGAGLQDPENEIQELLGVCKSCLCHLSRNGLLSFSLKRATKLSLAYLEESAEPDLPGRAKSEMMQGRNSGAKDDDYNNNNWGHKNKNKVSDPIDDTAEHNPAKLRHELLKAQEAALGDAGDDMVKLKKKLATLSSTGDKFLPREFRSSSSHSMPMPDGARSWPAGCAAGSKAASAVMEGRTSSVLSSEGTTVQDGVQSPETSTSQSRSQKHHKSRTQHSAPASPSARRSFNWRGWGSPFASLVGSKGWTFEDDETVHHNGIQAGWDIPKTRSMSMSPPLPDVTDEEGGSHSCGTASKSHSSPSSGSNSAAELEFGPRSNASAGVSRKSPLRSLIPEKLRALISRPRQSSEPKISEFTPPKPSSSGRKASEFRRSSWTSERHEALII